MATTAPSLRKANGITQEQHWAVKYTAHSMRSAFVRILIPALTWPVLACASASPAPPATQPQALPTTTAPRPAPAASAPAQRDAPARPRVRLVATGGTISNRTGGRLTAEELVQLIPNLPRYVTPEFEQFANVASSAMTLTQWLDLARRLNALFREDAALAGLVVTSGTDTLEELAYFLNLTVRDERPVVVVGSMRNPSTLGYEGAANLEEGFRVAGDPAARNRGVMVVLNDEINAAREVTKTDALRLQTFQTRGYGVLGVVDRDRVVFYRRVERRHTAAGEFDLTGVTQLPRVDVLLTYQGAPGDLIQAAVDAGAKGIVVATAGAGATSGTQGEGLRYAASKGIPVVTTTRTGSGRIAGGRGSNIAGEDLAPLKARILLMVALTKTSDPAELRRIFSEY
jgi:L-asparaginase